MSRSCVANCIVPPHLLKSLMNSPDSGIRQTAFNTLLSTARLRAERSLINGNPTVSRVAGQRRRTIYDCQSSTILQQARVARTEGGDAIADNSVNSAYDGIGSTYDFYEQVLGRQSIDGQGMQLAGYVHYGRSYNNAFWDGREMIFGDGDGQVFLDFTGSLDVIGHELTHGVTEFTAGLEYHNQSGALNESISDVFGSLVKQWTLSQSVEQADWLIGADIFTPEINADALRSLKDPGNAYDNELFGKDPQPAHIDGYVQLPDTEEDDWGGVHINSGIPNHAFYLLAINIGGNAWDAPGHIWYEALKAAQPSTDFAAFAVLTHEVAGRLYGTGSAEQISVTGAWDAVGVQISQSVLLHPETVRALSMQGARNADSHRALIAKIDGLSNQVQSLAAQIAALTAIVRKP